MAIHYDLIGLFGAALIGNLLYTTIAPFYPVVADQKGVAPWLVGQVFTLMPVAISFTLLGVALSQSYAGFLTLSFLARICGGVSLAAVYTGGFSYIACYYPARKESFISAFELFSGLGLTLGPAFSGIFCSVIGCSGVMFATAVAIVVYVPFLIAALKSQANGFPQLRHSYEESLDATERPPKVSMWLLCNNRRIMLDCIVAVFISACSTYPDPFLGPYMIGKGYEEVLVGFAFVVGSGSYLLTCGYFSLGKICCSHLVLNAGATALCCFGILLIGPTDYLVDQHYAGICIGLGILNVGVATNFAVTMPAMLIEAERQGLRGEETNHLTSALFSMSFTFGEVLGPQCAGLGLYFLDAKLSGCLLFGVGAVILALYCGFRSTTKASNPLQLADM